MANWHKEMELNKRCPKCGNNLFLGLRWSWPYPEAQETTTIQEFCPKGCSLEKPVQYSGPAKDADIWHFNSLDEVMARLRILNCQIAA